MLLNDRSEGVLRVVVEGKIGCDKLLWKYFWMERFISILGDGKIYFDLANSFMDPFEGAVADQAPSRPPDPRYAEMEPSERAFFELKRLTKIICWQARPGEPSAYTASRPC